jgi:hypothetical protein
VGAASMPTVSGALCGQPETLTRLAPEPRSRWRTGETDCDSHPCNEVERQRAGPNLAGARSPRRATRTMALDNAHAYPRRLNGTTERRYAWSTIAECAGPSVVSSMSPSSTNG